MWWLTIMYSLFTGNIIMILGYIAVEFTGVNIYWKHLFLLKDPLLKLILIMHPNISLFIEDIKTSCPSAIIFADLDLELSML